MTEPLVIAKSKSNGSNLSILPTFANRHGLITGGTNTERTITLQKMVESFSKQGVPVFVTDIKGSLTGIGVEGVLSPSLQSQLTNINVTDWQPTSSPVVLWDIFGERGHPIRSTPSDMGPLLLSHLLNLNEDSSDLLQRIFNIADNNGLLLSDLSDLKMLIKFTSHNAKQLTAEYGAFSRLSISAIRRSLSESEQQNAEPFFAEPILDINDLMRFNICSHGVVNILSAQKLCHYPKLYSVVLLWLLSELFEQLPQIGEMDKPKLVLFFDEAPLLFNGITPLLQQKIELIIRLMSAKGVGIYFVSANPNDIPDGILNQLGNRVQHASQYSKMAGTGEALISFLDEQGTPENAERGFIIAPGSRIGSMSIDEINDTIHNSSLYGKYEQVIIRESADEWISNELTPHIDNIAKRQNSEQDNIQTHGFLSRLNNFIFGSTGYWHKNKQIQTTTPPITQQINRQIFRGMLGSISGGRKQ